MVFIQVASIVYLCYPFRTNYMLLTYTSILDSELQEGMQETITPQCSLEYAREKRCLKQIEFRKNTPRYSRQKI